jgi:auxin responsive GH3 family protein
MAAMVVQVVVEGRQGQALNLVWEKMSEAEVVAAVTAAAQALLPGGPCGLREWAAREELHIGGGRDSVGRYVMYWELETAAAQHSAMGRHASPEAVAQLKGWAGRLDAELQRVCPVYGMERRNGRIAGVQVKLVAEGAFEAVRCTSREAAGVCRAGGPCGAEGLGAWRPC